jgi:proteasome lid subunit RPN8/RPN11
MRPEELQMLTIRIPHDIFEHILQQARAEAPVEACGLLAGKDGAIEKHYQMTNTDHSGDHFMMEPAEQFTAVKDMRSRGLKMLAIYHSHPETPARPSAEDIRLALTPDVTYVILSLQNPQNPVVKGFLIDDNDVQEVPVEIMTRDLPVEIQ